MTIDIDGFSVLNLVATDDVDSIVAALDAAEFRVFQFDGTDVRDDATFFRAALASVPVAAGATAGAFDSFRDDLRVGLGELGCSDVAVVWRHADRMLDGALSTLLDAVDCFVSLSRQVNSPAATNFPLRIRLLTFLAGDGPNFPALDRDF